MEAEKLEETVPQLSGDEIKAVVESLLFVSDKPLPLSAITDVLAEVGKETVKEALAKLKEDYAFRRGVMLEEIAGGYQLRTHPAHAPWIKRLVKVRPVRLSQAALEVLAIVAYRQPITRAGIEHIRGVDCGGTLRGLLERQLVRIIGKVEEPGRPILYGTSKHFLEAFGLKELADLPTLKEFQELTPEESAQLQIIRPLSDEEMADHPVEGDFMGEGE